MGKKKIIGLAIVTAVAALLLFLTGRKKKAPDQKLLPAPDPVSRDISEAERKKIAAEYGRKGAIKSAEVRRAKKAAREAEKVTAGAAS